MNRCYALVKDGVIDNVALVDDDTDDGRAYLSAISGDYDAVTPVEDASPGQYIGDDGPIPFPSPTEE